MKCDELAAYDTDSDLAASAKRPANQNKLGTPADIMDNCLGALSSLPREASRRIFVELSRGYILQANAFRKKNDQEAATSSYTIAVALTMLSSRLGSAQAEMLLGYIFSGSLNVPKLKYVFPNTPDYSYAWNRFEASAKANNPYGMLYAGSYLVWPGCSQNLAPSAPEKGLQYFRQAQDKKLAAAYFAEGYYWHFGAPGVKRDPARAVGFFEKAKSLDFAEADAFLSKPPPKPEACPRVIF